MEEVSQPSVESTSEVSTPAVTQSTEHVVDTQKFENPLKSRQRKSFENPSGDAPKSKEVAPKVVENNQTVVEPTSPEMPSWEPNFKVKVLDKEHEIPENFRKLIKDATSEKEVREVFERALGLDPVKAQRDNFREQAKSAQTKLTKYESDVKDLASHYQKGDMEGFFKKLGIPNEKLLQHAAKLVQLMEMPPEQRNAIEAQKAAEEQAELYRRNNQTLEQKFIESQTNAIRYSLDSSLARPDVQLAAKTFDERVGKPGAFRDEVITRGEMHWHRNNGQVIHPEQIIQEMVKTYGLAQVQAALATEPNTPNPSAVIPTPQAAAKGSPSKSQPNTIPNLVGRSTTPLKSKPKNLEDLKRLAKSF